MRAFARVVGWILTSFAIVWALLAVLMFIFPDIDEETGEPNDAALGGVLLTAIFGIPGGIMLWRTGVANREDAFTEQLVGFIYSHDRFTVAELARKIGKNEMETESLVQKINVQRNIGLAYHRSTREYIHYGRMQQSARVASQCGACGGNLGNQIVFEGEQLTCPYCNAVVQTQPAQPQTQQMQPPAPVYAPPGAGVDVPQPAHGHGAPNPYAAPAQGGYDQPQPHHPNHGGGGVWQPPR